MILLLLLVTSLCVLGIALGWQFPRVRWAAVIATSVPLYLASLMAWWWALYFQAVSMDRILAPFTHSTRDMLDGPLYLVPPLLPPAMFVLFLANRQRQGQSGSTYERELRPMLRYTVAVSGGVR